MSAEDQHGTLELERPSGPSVEMPAAASMKRCEFSADLVEGRERERVAPQRAHDPAQAGL